MRARIPRIVLRGKPKPNTRLRPAHRAFIRQLPCLACGARHSIQAAHVRVGTDGGVGMRPGDRFTVPLCLTCHAKQHSIGELSFYAALGIDSLNVALRLWAVSGDVRQGERAIFRARQSIDLARRYE